MKNSELTIKEGYKRTDIGIIPNEWETKNIEEVADVKGGKRLPIGKSLSDLPTPHPYIRVADVYMGGVSMNEIKFVPEDAFPPIKNYRIFKEDLFITVAGTLGVVGKIPVELDGANLTENADKLTRIKCNKDFLLYVLTSPIIQDLIETEGTLGAQPKLALTRIKKFSIPLPRTIEEQQAIAEVLIDTDALITSLDQIIIKKRNIKQGTMQFLLTGKESESWEQISLNDSFTLKARIGWQGLTTKEYLKSGDYHLITGTDFLNGRINWESCHFVDKWRFTQDRNIQLKTGDVLVTKDGTIGKTAFIDQLPLPSTLNSGVFVLRPKENKYFSQYLFYILRSQYFDFFLKQLAASSTISHLYQKDFVNFTFPVPSFEKQKAIAQSLSDMEAEIELLEKRRDKYKDIKQGMMQELLTGKTRLI
jgi:type I restriction enzyme S subunit